MDRRSVTPSCLVALVFLLVGVCGGQELPPYPGLSEDVRVAISKFDVDRSCQLSESVTTELEGLLLRHYDAITAQTESGGWVIKLYSACAPSRRAAEFLAWRLPLTDDPSVRARLLDGLAKTQHPVAIEAIVGRLDDETIYGGLIRSHGPSTEYTLADRAVSLLEVLFPHVDASTPSEWQEWWRQEQRAEREEPSN